MKKSLSGRCPQCGAEIRLTNKGYQCSQCGFHIPGYVCNRHFSPEEADDVLHGKAVILDGFSTNSGQMFSSVPYIEGNTVRVNNTIAICQRQEGCTARIVVGRRFFKCERSFDCGKRCRLHDCGLHRTVDGHMFTVDDIQTLVENGSVTFVGYDEYGNMVHEKIRLSSKDAPKRLVQTEPLAEQSLHAQLKF